MFDWFGYTKRLKKVRVELQQVLDELEPDLPTTKGKLHRVEAALVKVTTILCRVLDTLDPSLAKVGAAAKARGQRVQPEIEAAAAEPE